MEKEDNRYQYSLRHVYLISKTVSREYLIIKLTILVHLILDGFAKIGLLAWARSVTFWIWRPQNSPQKHCEEDQGSNILKNLLNIFDRHFCRVLKHLCICGNVNSVQNCYGKKCPEMIVLATCRTKYNIGPNNSMNLGKDLLAWL